MNRVVTKKTRATTVIAGYYPTLTFLQDTIQDRVQILGLNRLIFHLSVSENSLFGFETRSKVRQADIQLRTMKEDLIDNISDLAYANAKLKLPTVSSPSKIKEK
jgi:hypothetical protein